MKGKAWRPIGATHDIAEFDSNGKPVANTYVHSASALPSRRPRVARAKRQKTA